MPTYSLLDEPWIPVLALDGRRREVGIREVLRDAPRLEGLADPSPIVNVALHRLLLAVLHRVCGPSTVAEWVETRALGAFPEGPLDEYLARWGDRFDLFHEQRPFYQTAGLPEAHAKSISKLFLELASGNNKTLFDHTHEALALSVHPAEAARGVVAHQAYAVGGTISRLPGEGPSADNAPMVKGVATLLRGRSLFHTLLLNLHRYNRGDEEPFRATQSDAPAWERGTPKGVDRPPDGYLDLLTWQSRRILLLPRQDGSVQRVVIVRGDQFPEGVSLHGRETMLSFTRNVKLGAKAAWLPLAFREDRAIWRDSLALLQSGEAVAQPKILDWARQLVAERAIDDGTELLVDLLGLATDRATVLFWRQERLALPRDYLVSPELRVKLGVALRLCEEVQLSLQKCADRIGGCLLAPSPDGEGRKARIEDIRPLRDHLGLERGYWAQLQTHFQRFLSELAADRVEGPDGVEYGQRALTVWAGQVRRAALEALSARVSQLSSSARSMRAVASGEGQLRRELGRVVGPYLRQGRGMPA